MPRHAATPGTLLMLSLLVAVSAASIVLWQRADTLPPHQDEARQLRASIHYYHDLRLPLGERLAHIIYSRCETYPPLVYIATLPFYVVLGPEKDAAGAVNIVFIAILILSVYGIGKRLYTEHVGLAAAVIAACYPIIVGLSRLYVLELPQTAMVSLSVYAGVRTDGFRKASWCLLLGVVCGLGMLVKWHFLLFCAAPLACVFFSPGGSILLRPPLKKRLGNLSLCILMIALVAGPWYAHNYAEAIGFLVRNLGTGGDSAAAPPLFSLSSFLFFPYAFTDTMLLVPMTLLFLIGLGLAARRGRASPVLVLWLAVPLLVMVMVHQKLPRYVTPVLPAAALITAAGFSLVRRAWLRRTLYACAFAVSAANFVLLTVPLPIGRLDLCADAPLYDPKYDAWFPLKVCLVRTELPSYSMGPPRREGWPIRRILEDVVALGGGSGEHPVTLGWFIYPHLRFHRYVLYYCVDLYDYPLRCVSPDRARFLLTRLTTEDHGRRLASWCRPWLHLMELTSYPLPDGSEVVLYRTSLTRRRSYRAHELGRTTGEEKASYEGAPDGWIRHAERDRDPPGALVGSAIQPLPGGRYRLSFRMKYARPAGEGPLARAEVIAKKGGTTLASRDFTAENLGDPGVFTSPSLDFALPARARVIIRLLHTGRADLWIDSVDITPLGT